jgi:hypothetical protein
MSFTMFKKHKRTPAELSVKLKGALENLSNGSNDKARNNTTRFVLFA